MTDPWLPDPGDDGEVHPVVIPLWCYRITGTAPALFFQSLPSLRFLGGEEHEGATVKTALFRYAFDGRDGYSPQTVEQALSTLYTTTQLPELVEVGDRIGVLATRPDGTTQWVFDGNALLWSFTLNAGTEMVTIAASGVEKRLWDTPVPGAVQRETEEPEAPNDVPTDGVAQFNPRGAPNCSPGTGDSGDDPYKYPVFLDPNVTGTDVDGNAYPRTWNLNYSAAYLIYTSNSAQTWVTNPKRTALDSLLVARLPNDGTTFDPNNPSTYTSGSIAATDAPLTDRAMPTLLHALVKDYGFGLSFPLTTDSNGNPTTALNLFLKQAASPKSLYLPARGSPFDPNTCNLGNAALARDLTGVVNKWIVRGGLKRYEASFILAPGFPSASADAASSASISAFDTSSAGYDVTYSDSYRLWLFDESGEGTYSNASNTKDDGAPTALDAVLGAPVMDVPQYTARRRAPVGTLFTINADGNPIKYKLAISKDYSGDYPVLWDGSGTWQDVQGGFELLPDRIGVRVTIDNPNKWNVGSSKAGSAPFPTGIVKAVESIANPTTANPAFFLRLTCVIEGDQAIEGTAMTSGYSPLSQAITRAVDARDRYLYQSIAAHSQFNNTASADVQRDDSDLANAEAISNRTATEAGVMEGEVVIPRFTLYYGVGDRIDQIVGRNLGLRTDNGGTSAAPVLPLVVGRRFECDGGQRTILTLSDAGLDRRRYARLGGMKRTRTDDTEKWKQVAALATQIQKAGFGVNTSRI